MIPLTHVRVKISCRPLLQLRFPLAECRETVHHGAMRESPLRRRDILALSSPRFLRCRLQGAAIRESEPPGQTAGLVHGVEVRGRILIRLAAGQERNARNRRRDARLQEPDGLLGDFIDAGAAIVMFGLSTMPSRATRA